MSSAGSRPVVVRSPYDLRMQGRRTRRPLIGVRRVNPDRLCQCDADGADAAGDVFIRVLKGVSRTAATAGVLQRQVELAPAALGLPLRHRAVSAVSCHHPGRFPAGLRGGTGFGRAGPETAPRRTNWLPASPSVDRAGGGPLDQRRGELPR